MAFELGDTASVTFYTTDASGALAAPGALPAAAALVMPDGTAGVTPTVTLLAVGTYRMSWVTTMLGHYTPNVTWSGGTAVPGRWTGTVDVYGSTIIDPYELRVRYPDLADTTKYPEDRVRVAIRRAAEQWASLAAVQPAPFGKLYNRPGDGRATLALPDVEIISISTFTIGGVAIPATNYILDPTGVIQFLGGYITWAKPVVIFYTCGLADPPGAVIDAIGQRAVELLVPPQSGLGRMTSVANDLGYARLSLAGRDGSTGVPDFDATAALFGKQSLGFG